MGFKVNPITGKLDLVVDTASKIKSTASGNLTATNVQSGLEELQTDIDTRIPSSEKGAALGVAPLNASSVIDSIYLPSYVDDVLEFTNLSAFPGTGEAGKIYVALDTNKPYRWSGTTYVEVSPSDVNSVNGKVGIVALDSDDIPEGSTNLYITPTQQSLIASALQPGDAANTSLNNLTSTAINQDLVPTGVRNLGNVANRWRTAFIGNLHDSVDTESIDVNGRLLRSTSSTQVLDWSSGAPDFSSTDKPIKVPLSFALSSYNEDAQIGYYFPQNKFKVRENGVVKDLIFDPSSISTDDVAEGSTNLYFTDSRVDANTNVIANTAKVSADGSINTHSDVDTTTNSPSIGDSLIWDGSKWIPGNNTQFFNLTVATPTGVIHNNTSNLNSFVMIGKRENKYVLFSFSCIVDTTATFNLASFDVPISNFPTIFTSNISKLYGVANTNFNTSAVVPVLIANQGASFIRFSLLGSLAPASTSRLLTGTFIGELV